MHACCRQAACVAPRRRSISLSQQSGTAPNSRLPLTARSGPWGRPPTTAAKEEASRKCMWVGGCRHPPCCCPQTLPGSSTPPPPMPVHTQPPKALPACPACGDGEDLAEHRPARHACLLKHRQGQKITHLLQRDAVIAVSYRHPIHQLSGHLQCSGRRGEAGLQRLPARHQAPRLHVCTKNGHSHYYTLMCASHLPRPSGDRQTTAPAELDGEGSSQRAPTSTRDSTPHMHAAQALQLCTAAPSSPNSSALFSNTSTMF